MIHIGLAYIDDYNQQIFCTCNLTLIRNFIKVGTWAVGLLDPSGFWT